jgi:aspartyl-tRNA(Asn)/glutamyl-tRNA(Gln) amidotransferase subunit B
VSAFAGWEAVIGLEVHCQLATASKIFCGCQARLSEGVSVADIEPNANTCPVCAGHPGTLPVLNRLALEYAIRAGLATHCSISAKSVFARKNYFYPDLPKGYQISQLEHPLCEKGWLEIETRSGTKRIRIQRIHMEEDAGKNVHMAGFSLVNLNRAGTPLIEIVSEPDLSSAEEAGTYLRALHAVVTFLGITDGNMQEGNFRCDANVSVRKSGVQEYGTRVEVKNLNSFRFLEKAIDFEIARQIQVIQGGGRVIMETRGYDSARNSTFSQRSKEEAQDYRYFPDPDLLAVSVDPAWINSARSALPELPHQRRQRYIEDFALASADASAVTMNKALADFFDQTVELLVSEGAAAKECAKPAANWVTGEVLRMLNDADLDLSKAKVTPRHIADIVKLTRDQTISSTGAKQVLGVIWSSGESVDSVVSREGLRQVSDTSALDPIIDAVFSESPAQVAELKAGKEKLMGFFVGQIMKRSGGKANPGLLQTLIRKKLQ